jgi:GGDEF domain-containing protein
MSTRRVLGVLGTVLALIVIPTIINLITPLTTVQEVVDFVLARTIGLVVWQAAAVVLAVLAGAIVLNHLIHRRDEEIRDLRAQLHHKDQTISTIEGHLHDAAQLRYLDVVTGIPNEAKWKADIAALAPKASSDVAYHVALIDLVGFGRLNDELGYQKVDEILRFLANALDDNMRKNEGLYKRHLVDNALLPERLYRKYPGGDEFYVVAGGSEADMLGLLTRLQRLIARDVDPYVSKNIAKAPVRLRFSGAVCRLYRDEDPEALTHRLIDCLRPTRYDGAPSRLVWESRKRSSDFDAGTAERRLYEHAEAEFAASRP